MDRIIGRNQKDVNNLREQRHLKKEKVYEIRGMRER